MYYYEDHKAKRYFCSFRGILFKSYKEYLDYVSECGLGLIDVAYVRQCRFSRKLSNYSDRMLQTFRVADCGEATIIFDERNLDSFYIADQEEFDKVMQTYREFVDGLSDRALFDGPDNSYNGYVYKSSRLPQDFNSEKEERSYAFYIISYLPNDINRRGKRYKAHLEQIKNIRNLAPNAKIYVLAQNYKEAEYIDLPQIHYVKYSSGIGAQRARNEALKLLYSSDYDYGVITDDDICIEENNSAIQFFAEMGSNSKKFIDAGLDVIMPRYLLFNEYDEDDVNNAELYSANWAFQKTMQGQFHMTFVRNFKKFYGTEEYQKELDTEKFEGFDDIEFLLTLAKKGYNLSVCKQLIRNISNNLTEDSVVCNLQDALFVAENLAAARRGCLGKTEQGWWDYSGTDFGTILVKRERIGDYLSEIRGISAEAVKGKLLPEKLIYRRY